MGDVTLTIVAEKFQQPATDEGKLEENLSTRINSIRYYLYKDNVLIHSGIIDNVTDLNTDAYKLTFPKLAFEIIVWHLLPMFQKKSCLIRLLLKLST